MAFGSVGAFLAISSKTSASSLSGNTSSANLTAGSLGIIIVSKDNVSTTDTNTSEVTSISDAAGNTWTKLREWCCSQGAAGGGQVVSVWYTIASSSLGSGSNVTINFSSSITAKAARGWVFSIGAGSTISLAGNATDLSDTLVDPGSMTCTLGTSVERLWLRAIAAEHSSAVYILTATTNFSAISATSTGGGLFTSNSLACGEFRINNSSSETSNPTGEATDQASVFLALEEVPAASFTPRNLLLLGVGT